MLEKVISILEEINGDVDYTTEDELVDGGILDSFDIVGLVSELKAEFDVEIGIEDLTPENFNSAETICNLIERLQEE
ncbi:MAG: acyl carrier protein [Lachnospiraceae bacterium]|nr:acyl carrier protein [Lachnospiraceae bacterium]